MEQIKIKLQRLLELLKSNHKDPPPPPPSGVAIVTMTIPPLPKDGKRLEVELTVENIF